MARHLVIRLEAPLAAFGDVMVDAIGPVRDTPSASMLTGLLGNALGVRREETRRLARLQDRLVFACRLDRRADRFTEFQTAELSKDDVAWTTRGKREERAGGAGTYLGPHIRYREHDADLSAVVALRLDPADEPPDLDRLAAALDEPARPLFLGRKHCLPAARLFEGFVEAPDLLAALRLVPLARHRPAPPWAEAPGDAGVRVVLPADAPRPEGFRAVRVCDRRDWIAGVHAGDHTLYAGTLPRDAFPAAEGGAP